MGTMTIDLRHAGGRHAVEGVAANGAPLIFDGEGGSLGPTPMEHLLASAGACALMDVAVILRKKRLEFGGLRVTCEGGRTDEGHPKPFTSLRLSFRVEGDIPPKAFEDAVRLAMERYCNVGATLRLSPPVSYQAEVVVPSHGNQPTQ